MTSKWDLWPFFRRDSRARQPCVMARTLESGVWCSLLHRRLQRTSTSPNCATSDPGSELSKLGSEGLTGRCPKASLAPRGCTVYTEAN